MTGEPSPESTRGSGARWERDAWLAAAEVLCIIRLLQFYMDAARGVQCRTRCRRCKSGLLLPARKGAGTRDRPRRRAMLFENHFGTSGTDGGLRRAMRPL